MSASGLRLKLDRPSPITADSHLMLVVGAPGRSVEVKARVVWSTARGTGHDLGLQFDSPGPSVRTALFNLAWNGPDGAGPAGSLGLAESGASRE